MPVIRRALVQLKPRAPRVAPRVATLTPRDVKKPPVAAQAHADDEQLAYKLKIAAKKLGVSLWQVRRWKRDGVLPSFRWGNADMVSHEDLLAFVERSRGGAA